jgi:hypothetical protein
MSITTETNQAATAAQGNNAYTEPLTRLKRIGSTVYEVRIFFNHDAKETMEDKILRLIRNEAQNGKAAG